MYYGDKRDSLVRLMEGLQNREWKIYGFKEDMSDSMTDYFDPAYWQGIAVKNGFILVVDNCSGGSIGGDFIQQSYDVKIANRIKKLQTLADNEAASPGEKANALAMIKKFDKDLVKSIVVTSDLPAVEYQKNPGNSKWHIEKDGKIIAKGTGVFSFKAININRGITLRFKKIEDNTDEYLSYFNFNGSQEKWEDHYEYVRNQHLKDKKLLDKYFNLLDKWDALSAIKLGEGEQEALVEKTITKKVIHLIPEHSDIPTDYVIVGKGWERACGLKKGYLYKLSEDKKSIKKLTKKWVTFQDGKHVQTFKSELNKNTKASVFLGNEESHLEGKFTYIKLVKKIEFHDEVILVKKKASSKKKSKPKTSLVEEGLKAASIVTTVLYESDLLQTFSTGVLF